MSARLPQIMVCENGLGKMLESSCVVRFKLQNERDLGAGAVGRCAGCEHGARRSQLFGSNPDAAAPAMHTTALTWTPDRLTTPHQEQEMPTFSKKPCVTCGKDFMPTSNRSMYCHNPCAKAGGQGKPHARPAGAKAPKRTTARADKAAAASDDDRHVIEVSGPDPVVLRIADPSKLTIELLRRS
jgi:hypothetical protein